MWTGARRVDLAAADQSRRKLHFSSYFDENPRGFGLLQRDRNFDHYQDDGVYYDRRPSLWVEPKPGKPAAGARAPCSWWRSRPWTRPSTTSSRSGIPPSKPKPGQELLFGYRLYWGTHMPFCSPLAQTLATRTGIGGTVGQKRQYYSWHFAVDFAGGELGALPRDAAVEAVITTSHGQTEHVTAHYRRGVQAATARCSTSGRPTTASTPIDLRLYLRIEGRPLTETWIYQWTPPSVEGSQSGLGVMAPAWSSTPGYPAPISRPWDAP